MESLHSISHAERQLVQNRFILNLCLTIVLQPAFTVSDNLWASLVALPIECFIDARIWSYFYTNKDHNTETNVTLKRHYRTIVTAKIENFI